MAREERENRECDIRQGWRHRPGTGGHREDSSSEQEATAMVRTSVCGRNAGKWAKPRESWRPDLLRVGDRREVGRREGPQVAPHFWLGGQ